MTAVRGESWGVTPITCPWLRPLWFRAWAASPALLGTPYRRKRGGCVFRTMKKIPLNFLLPSASARAVRQFTPILACWGALGLLAGGAPEPDSQVVSSPPPPTPTSAVTTTTTTTTPATAVTPVVVDGNTAYVPTATAATPVVSTTVVTQAPPAAQQEVVMAQPSAQHVWLAGCWTWRDDQYQWMAGHGELPPRSDPTWTAPRWEQEGNGYRFQEGYWN